MKRLPRLLLLCVMLPMMGREGAAEHAKGTSVAKWEEQAKRITIVRDDWGIAHVHGRTDADAVAIAKTGPLTVPIRSSVPPLAVIVPLPDNVAATVPLPVRLVPDARENPAAVLILPPAIVIFPAVTLIAGRPPVPASTVSALPPIASVAAP